MLNTVIFRSLKPDVYADLTIPVTDPSPGQYLFLRDITGIEPVTATINSKGYGEQDGEFYIGGHVPKRNIVMKFGLNASGGPSSVSAARTLCYGYMMTKSKVQLRFLTDDHLPVEISGYVESLQPDRFSEDPAMQVSIICPKPNFLGELREVRGESGIDPDEIEIAYNGNLATGIQFALDGGNADYVGRVILETRIGVPVYQTFLTYPDLYLSSFWQLWIGTEQGDKRMDVRTSETDIVSNLLSKMDPESTWMTLVPGRNTFRVRTPSSNTARGWWLRYTEKYGGI